MWSGGEDYNDEGKTVRLYQPILYGWKPTQTDFLVSYIGGGGGEEEEEVEGLLAGEGVPSCALCQEKTHLLVQLCVPSRDGFSRRTFRVFACNHAPCYLRMFRENPLSYGGGGVAFCRRIVVNAEQSTERKTTTATQKPSPEISAWAKDNDDRAMNDACHNDDDWGEEEDANDGMGDLESKLAAMESLSSAVPEKKAVSRKKDSKPPSRRNFPCYELHSLQEPHARRPEGMDDDDVGVSTAGTDDKIQQMLARYMAEEEDEGILAALRGSIDASSGGGGAGIGRERDERLSAEDRALLTYTDRLKRSPRQVLRYACSGVPMWSIPVAQSGDEQHPKSHPKKKPLRAKQQPIPPCSCGSPRVFEFQLLPSLLHVLQVDRFTSTQAAASLGAAFSTGSMNWGNLAVFTCSNKRCDAMQSQQCEEYVVLQDSVEGTPTPPLHNNNISPKQFSVEPVVIAEGTDFGADEEESDLVGGDDDYSSEEEMDECSIE